MKRHGFTAELPPRDSNRSNPRLPGEELGLSPVGKQQIREIYAADIVLWEAAEKLE